MTSRLIYHGTNDEMQIGDRIRIRWHDTEMLCVVSEINQNTGRSSSKTQWCAFRTDDGVVHEVDTATGTVGRNVQLVCHAGEEVEAFVTALGGSSEKHAPISWLDGLRFLDFGWSIFVLLGLIGSLLFWLLS